MEVTMKKQPGNIMHQRCRFPRAVRRDTEDSHYRSVGVLDRENMVSASKQDHQSWKDLILNAWAILLRCYVRNDNVSFLTLCDALGHCDTRSTTMKSGSAQEYEAMILQYQLFDNLRLLHIHAVGSEKCSDDDLKDALITTAVHFSALCSRSPLQENEQLLLSARTEKVVPTNKARSFSAVYHQENLAYD